MVLNNPIRLNSEQLQAVKHNKGPLLIIAGAGTGKTTVVTERIKYLILSKKVNPSEILALTFTEKAAREMETRVDMVMPYGYTQMWISTFHSFCDRILRQEGLNIGLDTRYKLMTQGESIQFVRDNLFEFDLDYFKPLGNPTKFVDGMLQHFSRLQDEDVTPRDYITWVNSKSQVSRHKLTQEEKVERNKWKELANAYRKYDELKVKKAYLDFGDLIVKTLLLFRQRKNVLKEYQEQFKYVLVDEFQDTNYAQNELAIMLAGKEKNITVTGDDDQCLPSRTKVSTPSGAKKIKDIKKGDTVLTAVGKGHTSISKVRRVFKRKRSARFITFKTEDGFRITLTDNHKMFCFVPAHFQPDGNYFVYLMHQDNLGWRLGVTNNLPVRLRLERHADEILAVGSYKSEKEARFYESFYSAKYGLPTVPFTARQRQAIEGGWLHMLFKELDTETKAKAMAKDLNIELDSPPFILDGVTRGVTKRVKVNFSMCHRRYRSKTHKNGFVGNPTVYHIVQVETSNQVVLHALGDAGFKLSKAKRGKRFRFQTSDLREAWRVADKLVEVTGGILDKRFMVGRYNYQHLPARIVPASNVFPGMYLPVLKGGDVHYKKVISRDERVRNIDTYDLEIEKTHNFVADGVVVHNSIYRFRGAAVSNIIQFKKHFPKTKIVTLIKNYRSSQEILDKSYTLIKHNDPDRLEAVENIDKELVSQVNVKNSKIEFFHLDRVENEADRVVRTIKRLVKDNGYDYKDVAILVRANNHFDPFARAMTRLGVPYQFLGPGKLFRQPEIIDLVSYLKVLYNFEDSISFYRILSHEHFDINPRDLAKVIIIARKGNISLFEACEDVDGQKISADSKEKIGKIIKLINKHLKLIRKETAGQILYYFLEDTNLLLKLLNPQSEKAEAVAANVSKFFDKLKTYETEREDASIWAVVDWLELSSELGESPLASDMDWSDINAVNILTVHSAKGLEFPVVFLVNLVSQRFPTTQRREQIPIPEELIKEVLPVGDYHLQEERRLFYVGMTRAKDMLYFTAANYYGEGKREKRLSPFIFEALGDSVVASEDKDGKQLSLVDFAKQEEPKIKRQKKRLHLDFLSYSQIQTFQICPLHYKLAYILKIPTPPSAPLSFGTTMHEVMNDIYKTPLKRKPRKDTLYKILETNWVSLGYKNKKHEREMFEQGKKYLANYIDTQFDPKVKPYLLEKPFVVPIEGNKNEKMKVGGKIDRVDILPDKTVEIIDYKTSEKVPSQKEIDKDKQLTFYALAATTIKEDIFPVNPDNLKLSLYYFKENVKISTQRTREDLKRTVDEIFKVKKQIEESDFRCSKHILCNSCEFKTFCLESD
jgi:DNA helicase-2/ATP-dependent DNA helicase PcrA